MDSLQLSAYELCIGTRNHSDEGHLETPPSSAADQFLRIHSRALDNIRDEFNKTLHSLLKALKEMQTTYRSNAIQWVDHNSYSIPYIDDPSILSEPS